jgi:hypothetical protein
MRAACSGTDSNQRSVILFSRWSTVPVAASVPLAAYLATYPATLPSVIVVPPWKAEDRMILVSICSPKAKERARPLTSGPSMWARVAAIRMASARSSGVAHAGGGV